MSGVNKVVFGNQVAIDISDSTVTPSTLLAGIKAYGANGDPITGTLQLAYHITLTPEQYAQLTTAEKEASDCWYYLKGVKKAGGLFQRPANSGWELTEDEVTTYNYNSHEVMIAAANGSAYVELQNGWNNISELPSGYAPGSVLIFSAFFEDTTTWVISPIMMRVRPNGLIDVASEGAHNGNLYFSYNYLRENPSTDDAWYYTQASDVPYATIDDAHTDAGTAWSSSKIVSELGDVNTNIATAVGAVSSEVTKIRSHVGMIIHSTTLDTMEKVIDIYGGTTWIQHSGYVLRGATTGVAANSASKTGGNDNAIVPYHRHSVAAFTNASNGSCTATGGNHRHAVIFNASGSGDYFTIGNASKVGNSSVYAYGGYSGNLSLTVPNHQHTISAHNTDYEGTNGNTTNANIPNYKSVYIWERTV